MFWTLSRLFPVGNYRFFLENLIDLRGGEATISQISFWGLIEFYGYVLKGIAWIWDITIVEWCEPVDASEILAS